jgi:hypothetical protein
MSIKAKNTRLYDPLPFPKHTFAKRVSLVQTFELSSLVLIRQQTYSFPITDGAAVAVSITLGPI